MFKDFSNYSLINVSAVSEFPGNCQPPATGMGGCKPAAETARAVQQGPLHTVQSSSIQDKAEAPSGEVPLFPPDAHSSSLLDVWHFSDLSRLLSLCNAAAVQHCPGFLQPIRPIGLPSWTHISQKGAWVRLSPKFLIHPPPPLPGARGSQAGEDSPVWCKTHLMPLEFRCPVLLEKGSQLMFPPASSLSQVISVPETLAVISYQQIKSCGWLPMSLPSWPNGAAVLTLKGHPFDIWGTL